MINKHDHPEEFKQFKINTFNSNKQFFLPGAKETQVQDFLKDKLNNNNLNAKDKFPIGGYFDLQIDIDLFKGEYGIEIKIWSHLKSTNSEIERAIGQAYIYSTEKYKNNNFMFLVFCKENDKNDQKLKDFEEIIKKLNGQFLKRVISAE